MHRTTSSRIVEILASLVMAIIIAGNTCAIAAAADGELKVHDCIRRGDFSGALTLSEVELKQAAEPQARVMWLNNIGWIHQQLGDSARARLAYEQSVEIADRFLPQHALAVNAYCNLGALIYSQNDFQRAQPLLERAVKLAEASPPRDSDLVDLLANYAGLLDAVNEHEKSLATYRRAIGIAEKMQPANDLQLAALCNGLACSLSDRGQADEARQLFEQALQLQLARLGESNLEVADTLNNLGVLAMDARALDKSRQYLERALRIYEEKAGKWHVSTASAYLNLGDLAMLEGDTRQASRMYLQSATAADQYFSKILPGLSLAEQQAELVSRANQQLSRLLSVCMQTQPAEAYGLFYKWKGALVYAMRRESAAAAQSPEKLAQLRDVREKLSAWYLQIGNVSMANWQQANDELTRQKERLERELTAGTTSGDCPSPESLLAADEALVDIYKYEALNQKLQRQDRYGAILVQKGQSPVFIDIDDAAALDSLHADWINPVSAQADARAQWQQLQEKLPKVFASLPSTCKKVMICPDGELARIPWQLVNADGKVQVCQLNAPQELVALRRKGQSAVEKKLLAVGGVDFNARANMTENAAPIKLELLPGTLSEARAIAELARKQSRPTIELFGKEATKQRLLSLLPTVTDAHIATHGFFFDQSTMSAARQSAAFSVTKEVKTSAAKERQPKAGRADRGISIRSKHAGNTIVRNPLVESGIALAGANYCNTLDTVRAGFLTAEEMVGMDLSACRLITLSACDTGRGEQVTGQGVLGLRSALLSAGARTVVMSLWKVPDLPTTELMRCFYANLWEKKMPAAAALRAAQSAMAEKFPANPGYWAGWTIVGDGW